MFYYEVYKVSIPKFDILSNTLNLPHHKVYTFSVTSVIKQIAKILTQALNKNQKINSRSSVSPSLTLSKTVEHLLHNKPYPLEVFLQVEFVRSS